MFLSGRSVSQRVGGRALGQHLIRLNNRYTKYRVIGHLGIFGQGLGAVIRTPAKPCRQRPCGEFSLKARIGAVAARARFVARPSRSGRTRRTGGLSPFSQFAAPQRMPASPLWRVSKTSQNSEWFLYEVVSARKSTTSGPRRLRSKRPFFAQEVLSGGNCRRVEERPQAGMAVKFGPQTLCQSGSTRFPSVHCLLHRSLGQPALGLQTLALLRPHRSRSISLCTTP